MRLRTSLFLFGTILCVAVPRLAAQQVGHHGDAHHGDAHDSCPPGYTLREKNTPPSAKATARGSNKPSGIALKYLNVLKRLGAEALD